PTTSPASSSWTPAGRRTAATASWAPTRSFPATRGSSRSACTPTSAPRTEPADGPAAPVRRQPATSPDPEDALDALGQTGMLTDGAYACEHPRHERHPVERVVPQRQRLPAAAEQHLLVRHQATQPDTVHVDPLHGRPAGAVGLVH